jgi:hypothetical protein
MGKLAFDPFQKRNCTKYFTDRCRMNPGRPFERGALKKTQSLKQCLPKPLGDKTPQKEVGNGDNEQGSDKKVVKEVDHTFL